MTALELLAPAKNLACGIAAIDHGADAVYIGAPRFGARAAAGNSIDDIRQLCSYAHQFGAKVYVTLNTIVYDEEIESVRTAIIQLEEAGVDAILVQDMAILQLTDDSCDRFYLVIIDNSVKRDINLSIKLMGVTAQLADIINTIASCRTCSETWCTDIDGISTMIDSCNTTCQVLGWS